MFDTHLHLYEEDNFQEIYQISQKNGVNKFLLASTDLPDCVRYLQIAKDFSGVFCGIGVHPHHAKDFSKIDDFRKIILANLDKVCAISEVGLDYFYEFSDREKQQQVFKEFIDLANELNLPVVIHCRNAEEDCYKILQEKPIKNGFLLHCFSGNEFWANKFIELGAFFSIGGMLTFQKAENVRQIFDLIPDDKYMLETDSPYLAPVPFRGKRNSPAFLPHIVEKIAELRKKNVAEIAENTTKNAVNFFRIKEYLL